ncbi:SMT3/SUMO-activating complex, catalytic component UBA2 [Myxozyma melibiosi]|uniref:Ubiquitin-activating enzyme E1-like n=1 Tax=Myxozyma melibiosi TaxID=54550 RepID=A0ABR1F5X5_9ASCO
MSRDTYAKQILGDAYENIKNAKILMVGAGGIGCELLKNLVLAGFGEVHLVDLDTIDLSNLNRQFLFGHEHIKKSKALVAKETASKFNPEVNLVAYHANIKDPQFSVSWFKSFDLVMNALDNLDTRRYVNRMCLTANVPMIDSGTTGYNGQMRVVVKGVTECYECNPIETPKSFPVCTIRTTPSQPIHCIVWAKSYLFNQLFGIDEDEATAPELDNTETADNAEELKNLRTENEELKKVKDAFGTLEFPKLVFEKVFKIDIDRLLSLADAWRTRRPPVPLDYSAVKTAADEAGLDSQKKVTMLAADDQPIWNLVENFAVFADSISRLSNRLVELQQEAGSQSKKPILVFDKDDDDTLDFVTAAANLRSIVFGIETKSKFEIKQMSGNIIPAIATTNAIVAGLCVTQAFKILNNDLEHAKMVYISQPPARMLSAGTLPPANVHCGVCGIARAAISVDPEKLTLGDFLEKVLKSKLGYSEEVSIVTSKLLYDIEFDDNLEKTFVELGVSDGSFITIMDEEEPEDGSPGRVNLEFIVLAKGDKNGDAEGDAYVLDQIPEIPKKPKAEKEPASEDEGMIVASAAPKRKADEISGDDTNLNKKSKTDGNGDSATIVIDDEDGAFLID